MRAKDKLASARLMAVEKMPYFRSAMMALVPKEAPGLDTFGVTKHGVLLWDPVCLDRWSVPETAAVLIHEISHLLRGHADRGEKMAAHPPMWNIAGDLEINDDLVAAGLALPDEGVTPKKLAEQIEKDLNLKLNLTENMLAEEYYRELEKLPKQKIAVVYGEQGDGDGGGEAGSDEDKQDQDGGGGKGGKKGQIGKGRCGGCAGNPEDGEPDQDKASGRSDVEMERVKRHVAEDIRKEAERGRGTVPGNWLRWAHQQLKPPQIPWRQKLARAVRGAIAYRPGAVDYHYTRPSRRQAGIGFGPGKPVLPALRAPAPRVSVIVDTSGSMGSEELVEAASETQGVLNAVGASVDFCACDAKVQSIKKVSNWKDVVKMMIGGGGTDFRPPIQAMAEQKPRPDVVIFITDGQGPAPATPPPFRMVWVLVGDHRCKPYADGYGGAAVTYGEFIEITRNKEAA